MRFKATSRLPRDKNFVVAVSCPRCPAKWELFKGLHLVTGPSRYRIYCPHCRTWGYIRI